VFPRRFLGPVTLFFSQFTVFNRFRLPFSQHTPVNSEDELRLLFLFFPHVVPGLFGLTPSPDPGPRKVRLLLIFFVVMWFDDKLRFPFGPNPASGCPVLFLRSWGLMCFFFLAPPIIEGLTALSFPARFFLSRPTTHYSSFSPPPRFSFNLYIFTTFFFFW